MSMFDSQSSLGFPEPLSEKYRPKQFEDFIGLEREKKIITGFCKRPREGSFLFIGQPGIGKTALGLAMALELGAELHLINSQKCTVDAINEVCRICHYVPQHGGFHLVLVDEINFATKTARLALLSKLDATARPPKTIFVFTANTKEGLEDAFLTRCMVMEFSSYGMRQLIAEFLAEIWKRETNATPINFERIAKESNNSVRDALMTLEMELLAVQE